jgi:excisionase family DNA binding protein
MQSVNTFRVGNRRAYQINEATAAYGLSRTTLYKLIKSGALHSVKVGGRRLIPTDSIEALLADGNPYRATSTL